MTGAQTIINQQSTRSSDGNNNGNGNNDSNNYDGGNKGDNGGVAAAWVWWQLGESLA
jgi:hypothetical protein